MSHLLKSYNILVDQAVQLCSETTRDSQNESIIKGKQLGNDVECIRPGGLGPNKGARGRIISIGIRGLCIPGTPPIPNGVRKGPWKK